MTDGWLIRSVTAYWNSNMKGNGKRNRNREPESERFFPIRLFYASMQFCKTDGRSVGRSVRDTFFLWPILGNRLKFMEMHGSVNNDGTYKPPFLTPQNCPKAFLISRISANSDSFMPGWDFPSPIAQNGMWWDSKCKTDWLSNMGIFSLFSTRILGF